jgi:hypothetical protein
MKVKLLISMVGPEIDLQHGDIIDTNEKHAKALIEAGQAEAVIEKPVVERAVKAEKKETR